LLLAGKVIAEGPPSDVITPANLVNAYGSSILHADREGVFVDDPDHSPVAERRPW
jgi:hypothetical protein